MFGYYLELAFRNLKRNPGLTALMIGAVALGIAVCVMTLTMYRAMSGNPIWWKNDVLYAVTMDFWDPQEPAWDDKPEPAAGRSSPTATRWRCTPPTSRSAR